MISAAGAAIARAARETTKATESVNFMLVSEYWSEARQEGAGGDKLHNEISPILILGQQYTLKVLLGEHHMRIVKVVV